MKDLRKYFLKLYFSIAQDEDIVKGKVFEVVEQFERWLGVGMYLVGI